MKPKFLLLLPLILLSGLLFTGCATMFADVAVTDAIKQGKVYVNMPLQDLVAIVGHRPNRFQDEFWSQNDASGETFVWAPGSNEGTLWDTYVFTFHNGRLVAWRRK